MKTIAAIILVAATLFVATNANAGRTGSTKITHLILKPDHIAVYTEASNSVCGTGEMWILDPSHVNYDQLYRGFLASKLSGKGVDIVGTGSCSSKDSRGETISWAYVAK